MAYRLTTSESKKLYFSSSKFIKIVNHLLRNLYVAIKMEMNRSKSYKIIYEAKLFILYPVNTFQID